MSREDETGNIELLFSFNRIHTPPGVIYEYIAASVFYWLIAASIAELASAIPLSGGVYHWATITGGRYGRACGWFVGWWNALAWLIGLASIVQIVAAQWHVFVAYILVIWISVLVVLYFNRALPPIEIIGGLTVLVGVFLSILVCAVILYVNQQPYVTNFSVWQDWQNMIGYSNGFTFLAGMLNGAYTVGTPDLLTHLAEEVIYPSRNIPKAILLQYSFGFFSGFFYLISTLYGVSRFDEVLASPYLFSLAEIYRQAAGSKAGSIGLLFLAFVPSFLLCIGNCVTVSRIFWTLARDGATLCSRFFSNIDQSMHNPFRAIVFNGVFVTVLGCIYVGSKTVFSAITGSFVILLTLLYVTAILPHLLSRRQHVVPGWFWMKGMTGFVINGIVCAYIIVFIVIFCFPLSLPVDAVYMNYALLITGGLSLFVLLFWFVRQSTYVGPQQLILDAHILAEEAMK